MRQTYQKAEIHLLAVLESTDHTHLVVLPFDVSATSISIALRSNSLFSSRLNLHLVPFSLFWTAALYPSIHRV